MSAHLTHPHGAQDACPLPSTFAKQGVRQGGSAWGPQASSPQE